MAAGLMGGQLMKTNPVRITKTIKQGNMPEENNGSGLKTTGMITTAPSTSERI